MIKSNLKEEWLNGWIRNTTGRALYNYMSTPKPKDPINLLKRGEQSTIFRLRTGHVTLNGHLSRIKKNFSSQCPLCKFPNETVEHHLLHCDKLKELRRQLPPAQPSISKLLFCDKDQLSKTCLFFYRASGLRALAQR